MGFLIWFFSGIGVVLLTILLSPLRKYFISWAENYLRRIPSVERKQLEIWIGDNSYKTRPTSWEIIKKVEQIPPAQRHYTEQQYEGLNVVWSLRFEDLQSMNDNQVRLMLGYNNFIPWTWCTVEIDEYPELKSTPKGKTVWVAGTITNIKGHSIELRDVKLRFI